MREYRLRWQGGLPTAVWASGGLFLLVTLLFVVFSVPGWLYLLAALGSVVFFVMFPWQASKVRISVSEKELRKRQGGIFKTTRRIPRRFVTGVSIYATPLQRAMGVCVLLVHTAGMTLLLLGIDRADATSVLEELSEGLA